jgi:hypothetical protein
MTRTLLTPKEAKPTNYGRKVRPSNVYTSPIPAQKPNLAANLERMGESQDEEEILQCEEYVYVKDQALEG